MPGLILLGADHRVAPFEVRGRLTVTRAEMHDVLGQLSSSEHVREVFVLSTFNQSEVYLRGQTSALDGIRLFWQKRASIAGDGLELSLYEKRDEDAAYHLFLMGIGLDSAGPTLQGQALAQIKESLAAAREAGTLGEYLEALLSRSLKIARRAGRELGPDPDQVEKARELLRAEARRFIRWARSRRASSAITALKQRAEGIRRAELLRIESKISHLAPEERAALEALTVSIVDKLLHPSKKALKGAVEVGEVSDYLRAASELFDLEDS